MTSRPAPSAPRTPTLADMGQMPGLLVFGGVLLIVLGAFNILHGVSAIFRPHLVAVNVNATYVFGTLPAWGWSLLGLGILQALAGLGVLARNQLARWFGVLVIGLNMFAQLVFLPLYPAWSLLIIAVDVVALYGLTVYGGRPPGAEAELEPPGGRAATPAETPAQPGPTERRQPV